MPFDGSLVVPVYYYPDESLSTFSLLLQPVMTDDISLVIDVAVMIIMTLEETSWQGGL